MEKEKWFSAAVNGNLYLIEEYKTNDFDVNIKDKNGQTILMYACFYNRFEIVKYLIEHGVDINIQDKFGHTALIIACNWNYFEIAKLLIEHNANPFIKDNKCRKAFDFCTIDKLKKLIKNHELDCQKKLLGEK